MNTPLVSIIIPAYNSEKYLSDSINSCINQTYKNIEIIIVNDGSTDNTEKIISEYIKKYDNIKYFSQINQGACVARNRGLAECNGEYVKFLDSDDVLAKNSLESQLNSALKLNDNEVVYGNFYITDNYLNQIELRDLSNKYNINERTIFSYFDWNIGISASLIKTSILLNIKGFDVSLPFAQESDLIFRLALNGVKFTHQNEVIFFNRQHDSPTRLRNSANYTEYWVFLKQMKRYQKMLIQTNQYSIKERLSFIHYFIFKIKTYHQLGNYKDARQALIELSRFRIKYFREISFSASIELILIRIKLSYLILKFQYFGYYVKSLLRSNN